MKIQCLALTVVALALSGLRACADDGEVSVVEITGSKPVSVKKTGLVRITGTTPSGGTVVADVDGSGKLEAPANVRQYVNGQLMIGSLIKNFVIKPTKSGKITIKVTVKAPDGSKKIEDYEINVEE